MSYEFTSGDELLLLTQMEEISIGEVMLRREMAREDALREGLLQKMRENLETMRVSIQKGLVEKHISMSGLSGGDAEALLEYSEKESFCGGRVCRAVASSMAVVEVNASMGRIVAAPTAGASRHIARIAHRMRARARLER